MEVLFLPTVMVCDSTVCGTMLTSTSVQWHLHTYHFSSQ